MMVVGGLVVFFSAALDLLSAAACCDRFKICRLAVAAGRNAGRTRFFPMKGTFEVTLGAQAAAQSAAEADPLALVDRLAAASFVLSWAGLSVHAQVAGLMSKTGWRYGPFMRARLLHGILSMVDCICGLAVLFVLAAPRCRYFRPTTAASLTLAAPHAAIPPADRASPTLTAPHAAIPLAAACPRTLTAPHAAIPPADRLIAHFSGTTCRYSARRPRFAPLAVLTTAISAPSHQPL